MDDVYTERARKWGWSPIALAQIGGAPAFASGAFASLARRAGPRLSAVELIPRHRDDDWREADPLDANGGNWVFIPVAPGDDMLEPGKADRLTPFKIVELAEAFRSLLRGNPAPDLRWVVLNPRLAPPADGGDASPRDPGPVAIPARVVMLMVAEILGHRDPRLDGA